MKRLWVRINSPRIKSTMLFFYTGIEQVVAKESGSTNVSLRFGVELIMSWDNEFNGPDLQLWINAGLVSVGFGIETNPYITERISGNV